MSKRDERAAALARANDGKDWESMRPSERDVYRRQADREGFRDDFDPTDPADAAAPGMRGRLDDLQALFLVIDGDADQADEQTLTGLEIGAEYDDHELTTEPTADDAEQALYGMPLEVSRTTTFEIVFGTGGPDDRLLIECDSVSNASGLGYGERVTYEIRRILYRFSWAGKSADVVIPSGSEDYSTAERYALQVVPELAE